MITRQPGTSPTHHLPNGIARQIHLKRIQSDKNINADRFRGEHRTTARPGRRASSGRLAALATLSRWQAEQISVDGEALDRATVSVCERKQIRVVRNVAVNAALLGDTPSPPAARIAAVAREATAPVQSRNKQFYCHLDSYCDYVIGRERSDSL